MEANRSREIHQTTNATRSLSSPNTRVLTTVRKAVKCAYEHLWSCLCFDRYNVRLQPVVWVLMALGLGIPGRLMPEPGPLGITRPHYQTTRKNQPHILSRNREPLPTLQTENRLGRPSSQLLEADGQVSGCLDTGVPDHKQRVGAVFCGKGSIETQTAIREPSGPSPSCRVMDTVSKPHIRKTLGLFRSKTR